MVFEINVMNRRRAMYEYDGEKFSSIKKLARYVGLNEKTLTKRLQKGMSLDEACNPKLKGRVYTKVSPEDSISSLCRKKKIDRSLIYNRRRYGYSEKDAFNKPKKISKQGRPMVVNGVLYTSVSLAIRELGLEERESTIRSRLRGGKSPDEAFHFD